MPFSNKKGKLCLLAVLLAALFVCWEAGTAYEAAAAAREQLNIPATEQELGEDFPYLSINPLDQETEMTDPVDVDLSQAQDGYEITAGGQYHLTGQLRGTLVINATEQNVHLFLDSVSVISKSGPAIYCHGTNKLVITLLPGTENTISDSGHYHADDEIEACVYSECNLTFNGTGGLVVNGYYKDAIRSKDIVKVLDGDYTQRPVLSWGDSILEVKWGEVIPGHIKDMLKPESLNWMAFSKYSMCRIFHQ